MEKKYIMSGITPEYRQAFIERFSPFFEKTGIIAELEARVEDRERQKWTSVLADKDAENARLRAELESIKNNKQ